MNFVTKLNEKTTAWPKLSWEQVKNKNEGGSNNQVRWPKMDWSIFSNELEAAKIAQDSGVEWGFAVEGLGLMGGRDIVSAVRTVWRKENTLCHGVLALKLTTSKDGKSAWSFHGAAMHDVTHANWERLSSTATGWLEGVALPLMGSGGRAWREGRDWFVSQQENCLLKQRAVAELSVGVKPAL